MSTAIVITAIYVLALAGLSIKAARLTKSVEDYYKGPANIPSCLIAVSYYATFVSSNTFVGLAGKSYEFGLSWLLLGFILATFTVLAWVFVAPRFRELAEKLHSVSISDLFRLHYQSVAVGRLAACLILFDCIWYLAAVFIGASEAAASLLHLPFIWALACVVALQTFYVVFGGYLADVWTDSLQASLMMTATLTLPLVLVAGLGGWQETWSRLYAIDIELVQVESTRFSLVHLTRDSPWLLILGISLAGGIKLIADPRQLSRFYGLKDASSARLGVVIAPLAVALTYICLLPVGLIARAYEIPPEIAKRSDAIVPYLLGESALFGSVFGPIILAAIIAAAMSTVDSVLIVASAAFKNELLPMAGTSATWADRDNLWLARFWTVAYVFISASVAVVVHGNAEATTGIVELTAFSGALYAGAFLPLLLGALYWPRASRNGAIAGILAGATSTILWKFVVLAHVPALTGTHEIFVGLVAGSVAFVTGTLCSQSGPSPSIVNSTGMQTIQCQRKAA